MTDSSALPPIPDATGRPRPPRAPVVTGPWTGRRRPTARHGGRGPFLGTEQVGQRRRPGNPTLEEATSRTTAGAMLATAAVSAGGMALYIVCQFIVVGALIAGIAALTGELADLARSIPELGILMASFAGVLATAFAIGTVVAHREHTVRASAHIVQVVDGERVWLYTLTGISIIDIRHDPRLRLEGSFDDEPRTVVLPLGLLEGNQRLWDLVYHGIRHSVARGAQVEESARRRLGLPPEDADHPARPATAPPPAGPLPEPPVPTRATATTLAADPHLPPVPDDTGRPRPPAAPPIAGRHRRGYRVGHRCWDVATFLGTEGAWEGHPLTNPTLEEVTRRTRRLPTGWLPTALKSSLGAAAFVMLWLGAVPTVALFFLVGADFTVKFVRFVVISGAVVFGLRFGYLLVAGRHVGVRASAHIVQDREDRKVWTYELTAIRFENGPRGPALRLNGSFDRQPSEVVLPVRMTQANPALWALVYNGIRHSTAAGADVDDHTRARLRLPPRPDGPAIRVDAPRP